MRHIVGLDLSLTSAGVAIITETPRRLILSTDVAKSTQRKTGVDAKGKPKATLLDRYQRIRDHSAAIIHHASVADLVVIEGLISTPGGAIQDRTALWWIVVGALCRRDIPVAVASPTAMKRVIVGPRPKGSGPVDKVEVALAVQKLWPNTELRTPPAWPTAERWRSIGTSRLSNGIERWSGPSSRTSHRLELTLHDHPGVSRSACPSAPAIGMYGPLPLVPPLRPRAARRGLRLAGAVVAARGAGGEVRGWGGSWRTRPQHEATGP